MAEKEPGLTGIVVGAGDEVGVRLMVPRFINPVGRELICIGFGSGNFATLMGSGEAVGSLTPEGDTVENGDVCGVLPNVVRYIEARCGEDATCTAC